MNLGIVGSRKLAESVNAYKIIQDYIVAMKPDKIVSGGAIGVDSMAAEVAMALGYVEGETLIIHLPQPENDSRGAYIRACFERNGWIVRDSDKVLAVTVPGGSSGTSNTIKQAIAAGKTTYVQETI